MRSEVEENRFEIKVEYFTSLCLDAWCEVKGLETEVESTFTQGKRSLFFRIEVKWIYTCQTTKLHMLGQTHPNKIWMKI